MKCVILDVRLNGGGNTPQKLIRALMDRPYKGWNESTSLSFGLFAAYAQIAAHASEYGLDSESKTFMGAFADYFSRPQFSILGSLVQPDHPIYTGPVFVLAGGGCASACEDFLMPLKTTGRATIIGQKTEGTSGQPFIYNFGNGMLFRVSSKRMYFPDGSQFEGAGIQPDVRVVRSAADWKSGKDPEFDQALELARRSIGQTPR
jgi:carboxyl-terminal processing protease